jgi:RNA polymerase sigma-70 factor (ECF subfamily)
MKGRAVANPTDEQGLLRRARTGDKAAFERLIAPHLDRFYAIAYQLMGNRDDASDVVQEAMIKAYRSLATYRSEAGFATWTARIVRNCALDELKRAVRKHEEATEILPEAMGPSLDQPTEARELQAIMTEAIETLSDKLRDPLVLYDIEGYSYDEIASLLEINLGTVKSRLNRARETLRQRLSSQMARLAGYLSGDRQGP